MATPEKLVKTLKSAQAQAQLGSPVMSEEAMNQLIDDLRSQDPTNAWFSTQIKPAAPEAPQPPPFSQPYSKANQNGDAFIPPGTISSNAPFPRGIQTPGSGSQKMREDLEQQIQQVFGNSNVPVVADLRAAFNFVLTDASTTDQDLLDVQQLLNLAQEVLRV